MGLDEVENACTLDNAQSLIKENVAGMTRVRDVGPITHQEDYILDSNDHSNNKPPAKEDTAT